jgi:putative FmdB family regulatory protein
MPTYQYLCRNCEHRFDIVQSIHDDPLTVCPECAGTIRRVLHPVGVTFKGSGFYRTDSRESGKKKSATAAGKDSGGAGSSGGSSTAPKESSAPAKSDSPPATSSAPVDKSGSATKGSP